MRAMLLLAVVVAGAGCTSTWYTKPGGGVDVGEFNRDSYACQLQARYIAHDAIITPDFGTATTKSRIDSKLYHSCMLARGYVSFEKPLGWRPGPANTDTSRTPYCGFGHVWDDAKGECVPDE